MKPTEAAATVPTPTAAEVNTAGPTPATAPLPSASRMEGTYLKKQTIEAMMPASMPMYTTFFMPVAERPIMTAIRMMSGSRARPRPGMFLSSSTATSSASATKCSPLASARFRANLM